MRPSVVGDDVVGDEEGGDFVGDPFDDEDDDDDDGATTTWKINRSKYHTIIMVVVQVRHCIMFILLYDWIIAFVLSDLSLLLRCLLWLNEGGDAQG